MARAISNQIAVPGWSKRIEQFRNHLKMSQYQLGQELQYSPMAISRWERGVQEPPAECYIKLGKLAGGSDRWFFWERAGLRKADFQKQKAPSRDTVPELEVVAAANPKIKEIAQKIQFVALPLLQVHAGSHGEQGSHVLDLRESPAEEMIAAPVAWCPNPHSTSCLRVKGRSMRPLIYDGDIVAVDSWQTKHSELNNKIVVASHKTRGLSVSRFQHIDGIEVLVSDNRDFEPVMLSSNRNWRIVGKVLWLIRHTA